MKTIFKLKDSDKIYIGYKKVYNLDWSSPYYDPNDARECFRFSSIDESGEREISYEEFEELDFEWRRSADEFFKTSKSNSELIDEIISVCICDSKKFKPILDMVNVKSCSTCKYRNQCSFGDEWECTKYYPPKNYEEGMAITPAPDYGSLSTSELLSYINKTGKMPEDKNKNKNKFLSNRSYKESFGGS